MLSLNLIFIYLPERSRYPLQYWLHWLKQEVSFRPSTVMIDDGDAEINALRALFSLGTQVLICQWHVARAWQRNIRNKVSFNMT